MVNPASTYDNQARWDRAIELEVQMMKMSKMVLIPEYLGKRNNLAFTWRGIGRQVSNVSMQSSSISVFVTPYAASSICPSTP
jgi:hypothetical protein